MKFFAQATVLAIAASAFAAHDGHAQAATQTVGYEVAPVNVISVTGSPSLVINTATAGSGLTSATASGTYSITTNQSNRKITARIDSNMPTKVVLSLDMAAPAGAQSSNVNLTSVDQDVVTGISTVSQSGLSMTYGLNAVVGAGVVPAGNKTVTFTITAGA